MTPKQQRRGRTRLNFQLTSTRDKPLLGCGSVPLLARNPFGIATQRICFGHAIQQGEFTFPRETTKRAVAYFVALLVVFARFQMIAHQRHDLRAHVVTIQRVNVELVEKTQRRLEAGFLVSARAQTTVDEFGCRGFTDVMAESREHYGYLSRVWQVFNQLAGAIDDERCMHEHVAFRMPFAILWHVDQRFDFRKQSIDNAKLKQALQTN